MSRIFTAIQQKQSIHLPSGTLPCPARVSRAWPLIAAIGCVVFGLALIVNVHPIGDGVWFWYANALRHGARLYSGLHLPMQPLFVFLTEWNQRLLGEGWLQSKALAVLQDMLYCWAIYRVAQHLCLPATLQALLIAAVFGTTLIAIYYRFDDYHVTGHILALFAIDVVLRLKGETRPRVLLRWATLLGVFAGLSTGNRLNDGAFLFLATGAALTVLVQRQRWAVLLVFTTTTTIVLLLLILMTGDSPASWLDETILRAAAIKGGTGSVLSGPLHFPFAALAIFLHDRTESAALVGSCLVVALFVYGRQMSRAKRASRVRSAVLTGAGALGILFQLRHPGTASRSLADALISCLYLLLAVLGVHLLGLWRRGKMQEWNRRQVLFLFPIGQLVAGSMTSGQSPMEAYPTVAMALLVLPIVLPAVTQNRMLRSGFAAMLVILATGTLVTKWTLPYYWQHYYVASAFEDRVWYDHPQYGPMYLEQRQLRIMQEICGRIAAGSTGSPELLSVPWPYANYFCHVQPWHGYVQTWYDTTSRATIRRLTSDLDQRPPEWIVYERTLDTMAAHETAFQHGAQLPHRVLDEIVESRLRSGAWSLQLQECYNGANWLLIHTRPAGTTEPSDVLLPSTNNISLCARTGHGYLP